MGDLNAGKQGAGEQGSVGAGDGSAVDVDTSIPAEPSGGESPASEKPDHDAGKKETQDGAKRPVPESIKKEAPGWVQQRLSHYASRVKESDRRIAELEAKLSQGQNGRTDSVKRNLNVPPALEDYDKYQDYLDAMVDWKLEHHIKETESKVREESSQRETAKRFDSFDRQLQSYALQYDQPEAVYAAMKDEGLPITGAMAEAIIELGEKGPEVLFHLSQNPQEALRIASLPAMQSIFRLAKIAESVDDGAVRINGNGAENGRAIAKVIPRIRGGSPAESLGSQPSDRDDSATWFKKEAERMRKTMGQNARFYIPKV